MRGTWLAAVFFCAAAAVAGSASFAAYPPRTLTVLAAASLKEAFTRIATAFETAHPGVKVNLVFAGTQELRIQIEHGARADLIAAADGKHTAALEAAGLVERPWIFALNTPVLIVPVGNKAGLRGLEDLPRAERLVVGVPEVPIGSYTLQILDRATTAYGAKYRQQVDKNVVSRELNVRQIVAKVALGEADAAFAYATDARAFAGKVTVLPIPDRLNVVASYPAAILRQAPQPALARAWIEWLLSDAGRGVLIESGFRVPDLSAAGPAPRSPP